MNEELEALIKKALSKKEEPDKEKKPALTNEEIDKVYKDQDDEYEKPWQKINNR